ncbi:2,3-diphosphoglycerate synthetase [Rubrobacter indicoceani]|uniref:2,3-diphosphoglycerate synthetase n=1 Tax=Rubrobacter indicoceani TaxID=2051957 RepID=UPI000E5AF19E|nr:2,3-diphosphoglycerate synthetase [Rubrobacter indicoceani]
MRTLFLIDGEHYPPVVLEAIESVKRSHGACPVAAAFLGGTEKIGAGAEYGVPLFRADGPVAAVAKALSETDGIEAVVDLSDEPVIGYRERMRIASVSLAHGARYIGADFELRPPALREVSEKPSLAVVGTGKRVGKTAVTGYLARLLAAEDFHPGVVSMGRGGPQQPEVIEGRKLTVGSDYLLEALRRGAHAASDYYETAALSRVTTVGCRRCGGGLAGEPFVSNVLAGARLANDLDTMLTVFDGSGATMPPVAVDGRILVAGAHQDVEYIVGYLGAYRLLVSDVLLLTMAEEPLAPEERVREISEAALTVNPELQVVPVVFRPRPVGEVRGTKVAYVSTAPEAILPKLADYLEETAGCEVVGVSGNLSDRAKLEEDLAGMGEAEVYLTEIKAAAIDGVTARGAEEGKRVVYCDNDPVGDNLDGVLLGLARRVLQGPG